VKVVLREDVESLGRKGDLVDVADGYGRNYLVPRGLALQATKGVVKQSEAMRRNREVKEVRDRDAARELATRLTASPVIITARAGEAGKLFGSVTSTDIAAAITAATGVEVDRRKITLADPIRELGDLEVPIKLHAEVDAVVAISVVAE
jgi:large subunit ribosomal protein L9